MKVCIEYVLCGCYGHLSRECNSHSRKDKGSDVPITQQPPHEPIAQPPLRAPSQPLHNDQTHEATLLP